MVFGTTTFKCDECGNKFVGPAAEWRATVFVAPARCTKCGSMHTYPAGFSDFGGMLGLGGPGFYKKIWDSMDSEK